MGPAHREASAGLRAPPPSPPAAPAPLPLCPEAGPAPSGRTHLRRCRYKRSAASCASGYRQECAKQGIVGVAVRQELLQLVAQVRPAGPREPPAARPSELA
jgi:hypothetical protein